MEVIADEAVVEARLFRKDEDITAPKCPRAETVLPSDSENELPTELERGLREALDLSDEGSSESFCCER